MTDQPVPVLTLWQPWASLVALGVKSIETRSWSTDYRGPLAIHAGATMPSYNKRHVSGATVSKNGWEEWRLHFSSTPSAPMPKGLPAPPEYGAFDYPLPLGAIVATCELVDVVPIIANGSQDHRDAGFVSYVFTSSHRLRLSDWARTGWGDGVEQYGARFVDIEDQRPYGDFTAGRFAWLIEDVVPLDHPVPFTGGQKLTKRWSPNV